MNEYKAELLESEYRESDEWQFRADIRVRLHNPNGSDVIAVRTCKARPKYNDLVDNGSFAYEHTAYWWPESYPSQGDSPFATFSTSWRPASDIDDDDALMDECLDSATHDPEAEIDSLIDSGVFVGIERLQ